MRTSLYGGLLLVVAAPLLMAADAVFNLELGSVVLVGSALGAAVAIIPDRTPGARIAGFVVGALVAWAGFIVRAGFLPDSTSGRAVAVALTVALCVGVVAVSFDRLALWSLLLGAGGLAGVYELPFAASPADVLDTSLSTVTSFLVTVAVGFLVGSIIQPARAAARDSATHVADDRDDLIVRSGS